MPKAAKSSNKPAAPSKGSKSAAPSKGSKGSAAPAKGKASAAAKGKVAAAAKGGKFKSRYEALYEAKPKSFLIGQSIRPRHSRDLTRFVRWPKYITLQRQKVILMKRLKVPPTINQFTKAIDRNTAVTMFKLLHKYRPEDKLAKKARLLKFAEARTKGEKPDTKSRPLVVKHGINNVTSLIESRKAKLVAIAHDVEPLELVVWLPTLCRKMNIPYVIVKGKARLGRLVRKKNATVVALTGVKPEDKKQLQYLTGKAMKRFNNNAESRKHWGGSKLGNKSEAAQLKKKKAAAKAESAKIKATRS